MELNEEIIKKAIEAIIKPLEATFQNPNKVAIILSNALGNYVGNLSDRPDAAESVCTMLTEIITGIQKEKAKANE